MTNLSVDTGNRRKRSNSPVVNRSGEWYRHIDNSSVYAV